MNESKKINVFRDEYFFLSNFYEAEVTYDGLTYRNNEAAFQAQKTLIAEERAGFTELPPTVAKRKGRRVTLRPDWEQAKDGIMEEIVRAKFTQNADLGERLLATGDAELIEGNNWHDYYWGADIRTGRGRNRLGHILMRVRDELRNDRQSPE